MNISIPRFLKYKRVPYTYTDILIVEALGKYGPRNVYKIAKELGLPESTVRYRISRLKKRRLLHMSTSVYHTFLGLKKMLVFADINPVYREYLFDFFDKLGFWYSMNITHGTKEGFLVLYLIPPNHLRDANSFIEELRRLDVIYDYKIRYTTCLYGVNPSTKWYDLVSNKWSYDWSMLPKDIDEAGTELPYNLRDPDGYPILADYIDVIILKELELDPTISYSELARKLNTSPQNIYYHYNNHVIKNRLIEGFEIFFLKFNPKNSFIFYITLDFTNHRYLAKAANAFNYLPYAYTMGKVIGENKLFTVFYIPADQVKNLFDALNNLINIGILKGFEYQFSHYMDRRKRQTIPYKKFKGDSWYYPREKHLKELHQEYERVRKIIAGE